MPSGVRIPETMIQAVRQFADEQQAHDFWVQMRAGRPSSVVPWTAARFGSPICPSVGAGTATIARVSSTANTRS